MAEEVLKYKVEIDSTDVAEQLAGIRNQVDLAMSSVAEQQVKPTTFARVSQMFETANIGGIADQFRNKFEQDTQNTLSNMAGMLDKTATQMQLGFSRATSDLRRVGLLAPMGDYPTLDPGLAAPRGTPRLAGGTALLAATVGAGFDPTGTLTRDAFMRTATDQLTTNFDTFLQNSGVTTAGTALGTAIGTAMGGLPGAIAGAAVGNILGGAGQGLSNILTADARAVTGVAQGLAEIAGQNIPGAPSFRAGENAFRSMAQGMQDVTRSFEGRVLGITSAEQQMQVAAFAEAGGFRGMDLQGMGTAITQLPTAIRTVSQNLMLPQDQSANLIADMQRIGLGGDNVLSTATAAVQLGMQGNMIGADLSSMLGTASQGIQAVAGTTMAPVDAANLAIQSRMLTTQAMMGGAPGVGPFVKQMGGADNAAFAVMEQGLRHMMSPLGMARTANMMAGGSEGATIQEAMSGAASYFSQDPTNIFRSMVNQGAMVGQMNPLSIMNAPVQDAVSFLQGSGLVGSGPIPADVVAGTMMMFDPSLTASQASAQVGIAGQGAFDYMSNQIMSANQSLVAINRTNQTGPLNRFVTGLTQPFVDFFDSTAGAAGRFLQSGYESITRNVGDTVGDLLRGVVTERTDAIRNQESLTTVGSMIEGTHERLNQLRAVVGQAKMTEDDFLDLAKKVNDVDRSREADLFLARSDRNTVGFLDHTNDAEYNDQAYQIFSTVGYGATFEGKQKLAKHLKKRLDRGDDLSDIQDAVKDIYTFDVLVSDHRSNFRLGDLSDKDLQAVGRNENRYIQALDDEMGPGYDSSTGGIAKYINEKMTGMSEIEQAEKLWKMTGAKGSLLDADNSQRAAFMEIFIGAKARGEGISSDEFLSQFGFSGTGIPGGDAFTNRIRDRVVRSKIDAALTAHADVDDVQQQMSRIANDIISDEDLKQIRIAAGNDELAKDDIAGIILGTDRNNPSANSIRKALIDVEGGGDIYAKFRTIARAGAGTEVSVDGVKMSMFEAIRMAEGLDIKDDVIERANSMRSMLPDSLFDDDTANRVVETLALNEMATGRKEEFVKNDYRLQRFDQMSKLKQMGTISERLEMAMSADILEGSGALAGAIDFTQRFEGMDQAVMDAGVEQLKIAHYQKSIDANDAVFKAFDPKANALHVRLWKSS